MSFQKAERKKAKLRLAIMGPSGSGKTLSSILIAMGLGGKIAMIDTENGSGELYSHKGEYAIDQITAPYTPDKYIQKIHEAEKVGYGVIIIDSISHAWAGEGGMLEMVDKETQASRSKNSYMAWGKITPKHNQLIEAISTSPAHIICTCRTKTAYEIVDNGNGKKAPQKIGLSPVFRDGIEYEFTVVLDIATENHTATSSKDRTSLFDGQNFTPTVETGEKLIEWLNTGVDAPPQAPQQTTTPTEPETPPTEAEIAKNLILREMMECKKKDPALFDIVAECVKIKGKAGKDLTQDQCQNFIDKFIERMPK